ncbi:MAG: 2-C-methyl-D-erythritol 4-phosphate cytidylyltransferase [Gammaproteobacteria bacterium]
MPAHRYWAAIPAAGIGTRMGLALPKQYLPLHGQPLIAHSLALFCAHPAIRGVVVALSADDPHWSTLSVARDQKVSITIGGAERCHSVLAALARLLQTADPQDWVLVHDAARPCLRRGDLDRLIARCSTHPVGGLLALPVRDTMKRADATGTVLETVSRVNLWHALTPQMFRIGRLNDALEAALAQGRLVTDEAEAMELSGQAPRLVEGQPDNIKVTLPRDLALAERYLQRQREE